MTDGIAWEESPLYTFDCSWCCAIDLLRANRIEEGRVPMRFRDYGGWLVWLADDMELVKRDGSVIGTEF